MTEMCLHNITGNELHNTIRNVKLLQQFWINHLHTVIKCNIKFLHIMILVTFQITKTTWLLINECRGGMFPLSERQTKLVFIFFQPSSNYIYVLHVHFLQSKTWTKLNSSNMSCNDFPSSNLVDSMVL